ncbi:hypothetical protein POM88_039962 [Heracleum sosnowskyi]|uniref:Ubiquitin-like protease family profile domain-containing protein n=1 Tax=Heracleum sosnowskyi TaxID=360622 RepID=A0AAD8HCB7_9APIA|nr:hypothetical protein POM88_039962 [Heracleum sosnowskyi]
MTGAKEKRFVLAPYIQSKHWMLLMFCVDESDVYVFDPLKQKRHIHLKDPFETAYKVYTKYGGKKNNQNNLLWFHEAVQCPQQKGDIKNTQTNKLEKFEIFGQFFLLANTCDQ